MKQLTLLLPDNEHILSSTLTCILGAYEVFGLANTYWKSSGKRELFTITLAGVSGSEEMRNGIFTIKPEVLITEHKKADLIIVPAMSYRKEYDHPKTKMMLNWLQQQYKGGAEIASLCSGAFLLAATGLLDGKSCSTHWVHKNAFMDVFPKVKLQPDNLLTDENGIYTNGGAYSFLNLMIYLVEKYYDRSTAIYCSKMCQIEMDRNSQSSFSIFTGQKHHDDEMVQQAQAYIENNFTEKISIDYLSSRFNVGRRNFDRRFIKATGNTPNEYSQRVKVEVAKKAFETNRKTINEVMYEVGYSDVKAFREVFRKVTGLSPLEYKRKYYKAA